MEIETSISVDLGQPIGKKDTGSVVHVFLSDDLLGEQNSIVLKDSSVCCAEGSVASNEHSNKIRSLGGASIVIFCFRKGVKP